jgi:hypothetical protein
VEEALLVVFVLLAVVVLVVCIYTFVSSFDRIEMVALKMKREHQLALLEQSLRYLDTLSVSIGKSLYR